MDGEKVVVRTRVGLRQVGALLALSLAMIPVAFLTTGASAEDPPASSRYAVGSSGMLVAQDIAARHWGVNACGGQVEVVWGSDEPSINARSYWANPRSAYDDPDLNVQCRVVFNRGLDFSWEKFCTVFVHEYGHLVGRAHVGDGADVMSPIYRRPLDVCSGTPDPSQAPTPPAPAVAAPPAVSPPSSVVDAPVESTRPRGSSARTARARTKAKAKARAAAVDRLRSWSSPGHDH